jgi:hypothetical protein
MHIFFSKVCFYACILSQARYKMQALNSKRGAGMGEEIKGRARGGHARAAKLSPEERKEIAKQAAVVRWSSSGETGNLLKATHEGPLKIGETIIKCAVLVDGTRVLTQRDVYKAMGRSGSTGGIKSKGTAQDLPRILAAANLTPYISDELRCAVAPILFKTKRGAKAYGYRAEILPEICNVYLDARAAVPKVLNAAQLKVAAQCEMLVRGFARVGIIALVDEATGYQEDRDREALQAILDKYLRDQVLAKWAKTFPDQFYEYLFKLKGWQYRPLSVKRPGVVGHWTNDIVYARLAPGVLSALREKNPKDHKGRRRYKFFQWLTDDYGHPALKQHLSNVIFLMKASSNWNTFEKALDRAAPKYGNRFLPEILDEDE